MKPSELKTLLASTISAQLPVLIVGAPGIGKTSIVEQAAEIAKNDLVISHPAVADPTDAKGFPWAQPGDKTATFLPFGETAKVLESTRPTTWFLDDLGQAPPAVQASYMPWLLARQVNGHRLPDHVTIIAATNRRTDRAGVSGILEPVKSRFAAIVELDTNLDEWAQWALARNDVPSDLLAFLRFRPDLLHQFTATADLINQPSPRTWHQAGKLLRLGMPQAVESEALKGAVGEGAATELLAFLRIARMLPDLDKIIANPDSAEVPSNTSALYALSTGLASRVTAQNFPNVARFAQRMVDAHKGEFATLLLRDGLRRTPEVARTPAFVRLAAGELGSLLGTVRA